MVRRCESRANEKERENKVLRLNLPYSSENAKHIRYFSDFKDVKGLYKITAISYVFLSLLPVVFEWSFFKYSIVECSVDREPQCHQS